MRLLAMAVAVAVTLTWHGRGHAQTPDTIRAGARQLANDGVGDYQSGAYQDASNKLERAFATVRAPSIGLWSARALVKVGRWVQASERYLEVTRLDSKQGEESVQKQAQADAAREHEELQARIPRLTIQIGGATATGRVSVTIDGEQLASGLLGAALPTDPGDHEIEATQGASQAKARVNLSEGARETIRLELQTHSEGAATGLASTATGREESNSLAPSAVDAGRSRSLPLATWVGLGAAGAGIVLGAVTGLMAKSKYDQLSPRCPKGVCDPEDRSNVDSLNTLRTVSTVGFVAGGLALAGAGVAWLTLPTQPKRARVGLAVGPTSLAFKGSF